MGGRRGPDGLPLFWGMRGHDAGAHPGFDRHDRMTLAGREVPVACGPGGAVSGPVAVFTVHRGCGETISKSSGEVSSAITS
jgi:hypothetical protein